jgi:hypothetical protein
MMVQAVNRSDGRLALVGAMVLGYLPSFLLPFTVAAAIPPSSADIILLATSSAITAGSVLSIAYENAWSAHAAMLGAQQLAVVQNELYRGLRQALILGSVVTAVVMPTFAIPYVLGATADKWLIVSAMASVTLFPVLATLASVGGGILIAQRRVALNVGLQGVRGVFPVAGVLLFYLGAELFVVGLMLCLGELVRALIIFLLVRRSLSSDRSEPELRNLARISAAHERACPIPTARSILHHVVGLAALGSSPIIDRTFLAAAEIGAVTRFEMTDRLFTAASQICNNLFVLPRVARVAEMLELVGLRRTVVLEMKLVMPVVAGLAAVASVPIAIFLLVTDTNTWSGVAFWTLLLIASLPAAIGGTLATRLVVATGQSHLIPAFAITGVAVNLIGDIVGFATIGATGIVLSTVLCRYLLLFVTTVVLLRRVREFEQPLDQAGVEVRAG